MDENEGHRDTSSEAQGHSDSARPTTPLWEFRVKGQLSGDWSDWLDGLEIRSLAEGITVLCGTIVDQAALMGVLAKLNRLNLTLLSAEQVVTKESSR